MNTLSMKQIGLVICVMGGLFIAQQALAASFECAKAQSKVEHLICDDPEISKLDDVLGKTYQEVMSKANEEEKQRLLIEQKHWLKHMRNICEKNTCLKHAYWSRQAELETFFAPHSPLYKKESDKSDAIKQILATTPLYPMYDTPFCQQIFEDLKQMKEIRFIDPIVQTLSYEDPEFDQWKQQCKRSEPLHFSYWCERNLLTSDADLALKQCSAGYGLPPFKLFELPPIGPSDGKTYIFYSDEAYGPMNEEWHKPTLGGSFAGFQQFNFPNCKLRSSSIGSSSGGVRNGPNYNSIIQYKKQYYFLGSSKKSVVEFRLGQFSKYMI